MTYALPKSKNEQAYIRGQPIHALSFFPQGKSNA